jgi:molybdopterin synthase catalytic subunit
MDLRKIIAAIKTHPDYHRAGMILCHNGIVRGTSRDGRRVSGIRVAVDHGRLQKVIEEHKQLPGIIEIVVEIAEDRYLQIGEDVMLLVVAGDIREHVIDALAKTLNAIKTTVTQKTEYFVDHD